MKGAGKKEKRWGRVDLAHGGKSGPSLSLPNDNKDKKNYRPRKKRSPISGIKKKGHSENDAERRERRGQKKEPRKF